MSNLGERVTEILSTEFPAEIIVKSIIAYSCKELGKVSEEITKENIFELNQTILQSIFFLSDPGKARRISPQLKELE